MKPLVLANIHKSFEAGTEHEKQILTQFNLQLNQGDFVTVIGSNGAGKSTLMGLISGAIQADQGEIYLDGQNVTTWNATQRSALIGNVFQDPRMGTATRLTIEENLAIALRRGLPRGLKRALTSTNRAQMQSVLQNLGMGLENRLSSEVRTLSGGQRQALTLLMAILREPKILLLDEHTAALDPKTSERILELTQQLVEQYQLTTLMITHNLRDALRFGNRLIMLHQGKIVLDISNEEKKQLTEAQLIQLFMQHSL